MKSTGIVDEAENVSRDILEGLEGYRTDGLDLRDFIAARPIESIRPLTASTVL